MPNPWVRRLEQFGALSLVEAELLEKAASFDVRAVGADQDLINEGDRPSACILLLEGFACRYKLLRNGRRQIMAFEIAGDLCDLNSFLLGESDHSIGTLTPCTLAFIPHEAIRTMMDGHPNLARLLWRGTLVDGAMFRAWMTNIGQRSAFERISHLFCETLLRLRAVGLAMDDHFELPITQAELGEALGLSTVHVNRTLQELRGKGLIVLRSGRVTIPDWEALESAAGFNPNYLHLGGREAGDRLGLASAS